MNNLMKISITIMALVLMTKTAHANCAAAALWAAEDTYDNDPIKTRTSTVIPGVQYRVTVGIGNPEDGAHTYLITFKDGVCDPKNADIKDLTQPGYDH